MSLEPIALDILHRERTNKVFGKCLHTTAHVLLVTLPPTSSTLMFRRCQLCCFDVVDLASYVVDHSALTSSTMLRDNLAASTLLTLLLPHVLSSYHLISRDGNGYPILDSLWGIPPLEDGEETSPREYKRGKSIPQRGRGSIRHPCFHGDPLNLHVMVFSCTS